MKAPARHKPEPVEVTDKPPPTAMEGHVRHAAKTRRKIQTIADEVAGHLGRLHGEGTAAASLPATPADITPGGLDTELAVHEAETDKALDRLAALVRKLSKHA